MEINYRNTHATPCAKTIERRQGTYINKSKYERTWEERMGEIVRRAERISEKEKKEVIHIIYYSGLSCIAVEEKIRRKYPELL